VDCIEKEVLVKEVERECGESVPIGIEPDKMFIKVTGPLQQFVGEVKDSRV
jgi:hypothetical protein